MGLGHMYTVYPRSLVPGPWRPEKFWSDQLSVGLGSGLAGKKPTQKNPPKKTHPKKPKKNHLKKPTQKWVFLGFFDFLVSTGKISV